jgi:hypothetical protein
VYYEIQSAYVDIFRVTVVDVTSSVIPSSIHDLLHDDLESWKTH